MSLFLLCLFETRVSCSYTDLQFVDPPASVLWDLDYRQAPPCLAKMCTIYDFTDEPVDLQN